MTKTKEGIEVKVGQVWRDPDDGVDYTVKYVGGAVRMEGPDRGPDTIIKIFHVDRLTDPDEMWKLIKDV